MILEPIMPIDNDRVLIPQNFFTPALIVIIDGGQIRQILRAEDGIPYCDQGDSRRMVAWIVYDMLTEGVIPPANPSFEELSYLMMRYCRDQIEAIAPPSP